MRTVLVKTVKEKTVRKDTQRSVGGLTNSEDVSSHSVPTNMLKKITQVISMLKYRIWKEKFKKRMMK